MAVAPITQVSPGGARVSIPGRPIPVGSHPPAFAKRCWARRLSDSGPTLVHALTPGLSVPGLALVAGPKGFGSPHWCHALTDAAARYRSYPRLSCPRRGEDSGVRRNHAGSWQAAPATVRSDPHAFAYRPLR